MANLGNVILKKKPAKVSLDQDAFALTGGLNLIESEMTIPNGECLSAINYEMGIKGGYERTAGYVKYDGTTEGDAYAPYWIMPWKSSTSIPNPYPAAGDVIDGADSGADGTLLAITQAFAPVTSNEMLYSEALATYWTKERYGDLDDTTNNVSYLTSLGDTVNLTAFRDPTGGTLHTANASNGFSLPETTFTAEAGEIWQFDFWFALDDRDAADRLTAEGIGFEITTVGSEVTWKSQDDASAGDGQVNAKVVGGIEQSYYDDGVTAVYSSGNCDVAASYDSSDSQITDVLPGIHVTITMHVDSVSGSGQFGFLINAKGYNWSTYSNTWFSTINEEIDNDSHHTLIGAMQLSEYTNGTYVSPPEKTTYDMTTSTSTGGYYYGNLIFKDSGGFNQGEVLEIGGVDTGMTSNGSNVKEGESDPDLHASYLELASVNALSGIGQVGVNDGSGPIRGVWFYNDVVFAFRDSGNGSKGILWKSSGGGWSEVTPNTEIYFVAGTGTAQIAPLVGTTIEDGTTGATATIERVITTSGSWGVDAAGYFVVSNITGGVFSVGNDIEVSAVKIAEVDPTTASATPTFPAGGEYEFRNYNFSGHAARYSFYGVNGVGRAFEYCDDAQNGDEVVSFITTGMTNDTPNHLGVHLLHLFLMFPGGSVQHSSLSDPLQFRVVTGAQEYAVGNEGTGFLEEVGKLLFIFTRNQTYVLNGDSAANFDLEIYNPKAGAHPNSIGRIGVGVFFDDRGFTTMQSTDKYGDYLDNSISQKIQPVINEIIDGEISAVGSMTLRRKNLYRCFFDDGTIISIGWRDKKISGIMRLEYKKNVVCVCCEEGVTGRERMFFGSDDGWIYEGQVGNSFDSEDIDYHVRLAFAHTKNPMMWKKYKQARLDAHIGSTVTLDVLWNYNLNDPDYSKSLAKSVPSGTGGGTWDSFTWDSFTWDKPMFGLYPLKMEGEGVNFAALFSGSTSSDPAHTLRGLTAIFEKRHIDRRT